MFGFKKNKETKREQYSIISSAVREKLWPHLCPYACTKDQRFYNKTIRIPVAIAWANTLEAGDLKDAYLYWLNDFMRSTEYVIAEDKLKQAVQIMQNTIPLPKDF